MAACVRTLPMKVVRFWKDEPETCRKIGNGKGMGHFEGRGLSTIRRHVPGFIQIRLKLKNP